MTPMPLAEKSSYEAVMLNKGLLAESLNLDFELRALLKRFWACPEIKAGVMDCIHSNNEVIKCLRETK